MIGLTSTQSVAHLDKAKATTASALSTSGLKAVLPTSVYPEGKVSMEEWLFNLLSRSSYGNSTHEVIGP